MSSVVQKNKQRMLLFKIICYEKNNIATPKLFFMPYRL